MSGNTEEGGRGGEKTHRRKRGRVLNDLNCGSNLEELRWCMMKTKKKEKKKKGGVGDENENGEKGEMETWKASGNACP